MSSDPSASTYAFLDFKFNPGRHQLYYKNQTIQLSKKNHDLLLALVQSNGQVITKDQLIDSVWPKQIVTDAALNKQITRLRQILAEFDPSTLIETVRGVGIRFSAQIQVETPENTQIRENKKTNWVIATILIAAGLLLWLLQNNKPAESPDLSQVTTINMAIIPMIANDDWLNVGTIDYLSDQLLEHPTIQTIEPETDWFNHDSAEVLGIELSQTTGIEYVLMLESQNLQDSYTAHLSLRNAHQVIAKKSFNNDSISLLLNQIEAWALEQLNIETELTSGQAQKNKETTEFVMENYLRGLAAAQAKRLTQAQRLLSTATDQDPQFYPAWFTLAEVESELGNFDKALSLINTLANSKSISSELNPRIQSVQAKILVYLNRLEEAQDLLDQSTHSAEQTQDINIIMKNLATQSMLHSYQNFMSDADLLIQNKLLNLTKKYNPSPNQIAAVEHNLAVTYSNTGSLVKATEMINSAIHHFSTTNNAEGVVSSYRVLADIYAMQAKNGEALIAIEKAKPYLTQVEGARTLANFWITKARNQYEQGKLSAAKESIDALHQMAVTYATLQPKVKAWIIEVELAITHGDYQEARRVVNLLLATILEDPEAYPLDGPYTVALDLYTDLLNKEIESVRTKKQQYLNAFPQLADWIEYELKRIDAHLMAADGYQQQAITKLYELEQLYLSQQDTLTANFIAKEILELHDPNDLSAIEKVINRVKNRPHFVYPINKFKAQLLHQQGKLIPAITLLSELKVQAKDFWKPKDQLMLESWQIQNNQP